MMVTPVLTGPTPTLSRSLPADERDLSDLNARYVGNRIQRAGRALERHADVPRALDRCGATDGFEHGTDKEDHWKSQPRSHTTTFIHTTEAIGPTPGPPTIMPAAGNCSSGNSQ